MKRQYQCRLRLQALSGHHWDSLLVERDLWRFVSYSNHEMHVDLAPLIMFYNNVKTRSSMCKQVRLHFTWCAAAPPLATHMYLNNNYHYYYYYIWMFWGFCFVLHIMLHKPSELWHLHGQPEICLLIPCTNKMINYCCSTSCLWGELIM